MPNTDPPAVSTTSTESHTPVELATVTTDIEAGALVSALEAAGIKASSTGGYTAGFRAQAPGVIQIWVRQMDFQAARNALASIQRASNEIDWSKVDVGDPDE